MITFPLSSVSRGNRYNMEDYIDQIEKFLRGQMSKEEEGLFKALLKTDAQYLSQALLVTYILKQQNNG